MRIGFYTLVLAFLTTFISVPALAQKSLKIVAVDTEKAIEESIWGKKAVEELGKEREGWRKKLEQMNKEEIEPLEEQLAKQRAFLEDKAAEQKLQNEIDDKKQGLDVLIQQGNESLAAKQEELLKPILDEMKAAINKLSVAEGYDIVLEKRLIVLYLNPELDITNRVTVMLDEVYKEQSKDQSADKAKEPEKKEPEKKEAKQ